MSEQNVKVVERIVRGATRDWASVVDLLDADVRLDQSRFVDGGVYRGRSAFRAFYRRWFGTWDELRVVPDQFVDCGERVLVLMTLNGRGKGSGVPVNVQAADVWTLRDGKVVELVGFTDQAEALEAVGMSE